MSNKNKPAAAPINGAAANSGTEKPAEAPKAPTAKDIAKALGVDVIYENSKGEFFTNDNLAVLSEAGKQDKVKKHDFSKGA